MLCSHSDFLRFFPYTLKVTTEAAQGTKMEARGNDDVETTRLIARFTFDKCYFCWGEEWNMPRTACCDRPRHEKCEKRYRRILASYTKVCGYCRKPFKDPCDPLTESMMDDTMALYKRVGCPVIHPEEETKCTCAMCSYFLKAQTKFHKLDMFNLLHKTMHCPFENDSCKTCAKSCQKLKKFYLNAPPF
ncbi:uncharacterized protein LOC141891508 [Acropora palmata]|uniref:uncharacterized protein LOC141891508 n=1 Tax=Acropora palmata TaxID=6131 RepID=UPI003DA0FC42